ncbi:MAG: polyprenyl synthetase family protein [Ignisphaera sp.]|uniref:Polyprenyl synthetase family protein n=1 Tax=Ignisphaera aggregans TaxID=334771 RepID=A0A7C4JIG3_9CREN
MSFLEYALRISEKVNKFAFDTIRGMPAELYDASLHYIKAGGKRIRPLITVLACRIAGGNEDMAIPGATAVEVLHTFTLIHDDIIDKDDFRRGVPTVHRLWGIDIAILAGDTLHAYAHKCLLRALEFGVPPERVLRAVEYLTKTTITIAEGQALDMLLPTRHNVDVNDYIEMVSKKTAALFAASAAIGSTLAGAHEKLVQKLQNTMIYAGIAFQIRDDILGLVGDEKILGKPVYSDIREGKMTILVIHALNKAKDDEKKKILFALGNRAATPEELKEVAELIKNLGSIEFADDLAESYATKALNLVREIDTMDSEALIMLNNVVEFMVRRNY